MMFDVALMYLSIPRANKGRNHPNPLSFSTSPPEFPGFPSFEYEGDDKDDGNERSEGGGRRWRVERAMTSLSAQNRRRIRKVSQRRTE